MFPTLSFPTKFSECHPPLTTNFEFLPIFAVSIHFPLFHEIVLFPYFSKFTPDFVKFTCFYILYMFFVSPYFDDDAFMHHTMHVLDAPVEREMQGRIRGNEDGRE